MPVRVFPRLVRAALGLSLLIAGARPALADPFEDGVLAELNFARAHPSDYGRQLQRGAEGEGPQSESLSFARDDPQALDEAIDFLMRQQPLAPLRPDPQLAAAAAAHVAVQGRTGATGHGDASGAALGQRLHLHGVWAGLAGEDISYGYHTPQEVVRQLIIDSGVPGRGHRQNIFDPTYEAAGAACGRHRVYGAMCVIDFAGAEVRR